MVRVYRHETHKLIVSIQPKSNSRLAAIRRNHTRAPRGSETCLCPCDPAPWLPWRPPSSIKRISWAVLGLPTSDTWIPPCHTFLQSCQAPSSVDKTGFLLILAHLSSGGADKQGNGPSHRRREKQAVAQSVGPHRRWSTFPGQLACGINACHVLPLLTSPRPRDGNLRDVTFRMSWKS